MSFLRTNSSFLHHFIKPYRLSIMWASLFSLVLSLCATLISILVGPALRLLMDLDFTKKVPLVELFGPRLSRLFYFLFERHELSLEHLIASLPLLLLSIAF